MISRACDPIGTSTDRPAWLALRKTGLGASDIPAILGISPWASEYSVAAEKLGFTEPTEDTELLQWGRVVEPTIVKMFREETGRRAKINGLIYRSRAHPVLLATLDANQIDSDRPKGQKRGTLECKFTRFRTEDWDEGIPDHVEVQKQGQLAVMGLGWGSVAVTLDGYKFRWRDVQRREDFIQDELIPKAEAFWSKLHDPEHVFETDGSDATARAIAARFPSIIPGKTVELDPALQLTAVTFELEKKLHRESEKRAKAAKNALFAAIGDAEVGVFPDGMTYRTAWVHRKGGETKASDFRTIKQTAEGG